MSAAAPPTHDPTAPMWRAAQVFRLLSFVYAAGFEIASVDELDHPVLGWVLFGVLSVWTLMCAVAYLHGFGRRPAWVLAEFIVVAALIWSTHLVASQEWIAANQSWPTTLWATNVTISAAILRGPILGMLAGCAMMAVYGALKGYVNVDLARNATIVIELAVGLAVGMAAQTARRAHAELERAVRMSAAVAERERLARHVHDGVIQVLALVAKRGREIGGAAGELAVLAGEQERALRRLVSTQEVPDGADAGWVDLRLTLNRFAAERVVVSVPATVVPLPAGVVAEIGAAVGNVLDNVSAHAGADATAFVLLEDLGDRVIVSVRDDGVGIAPGRLRQAEAEGRMGISRSIVGRLQAVGGTADLTTEAGGGVEWELTVPRDADGQG